MKKTPRCKWRCLALALCFAVLALTACAAPMQSDIKPTVERTPEPAPAPTDDPDGWPESFSLHEAYQDDFLIGTIYTKDSQGGADKDLTLHHFNAITPENIMKPEYMQPDENRFFYDETDAMIEFASDNNLQLIGHTLVWHQQTGDWLGQNVGKEQAIEQLRAHIMGVAGKYKGSIAAWDVVNEAIVDDMSLPADGDWTKCLRQTQWLKSIGPEYIALAFGFAREADPHARLYYNDYNLNVKAKAEVVAAMVSDLRNQGVPIDGIGMQGHYNTDTTAKSVESSLELFSKLGVEISITELDVSVSNADATGLTQEQEISQALVYARLFNVFKAYKDVIARVTFWGYVDNKSWRNDRFPCLFNADYSPKQAAYAVLDPDKYLSLYDTGEKVAVKMATAMYGTPAIDGEVDDIWASARLFSVNTPTMAWEGAKGKVRMLWDESFIYVLFTVQDDVLNMQSDNAHEHDSVEVFLDQNNGKADTFEADDGHYRVNYAGDASLGSVPDIPGFKSAVKLTEGGYLVEMAIPLLTPAEGGMIMGFDAQVNDSDASGALVSIMKFNSPANNSHQSPELWGSLILVSSK